MLVFKEFPAYQVEGFCYFLPSLRMILITGANGFLGYYLTDLLLQKGFVVLATGKGPCRLPFNEHANFIYVDMDFTDPFAVHDVFEKYHPAIIVHAGAMSKPDECELNQWQCYVTNVEATLSLLANAEEQKSHFIFISTDFVFSGDKGMYREEDHPSPVNFYGKSKLDAEDGVREYTGDWCIVRTVLVYGNPATGKQNILTVVKDKLEKGEIYKVFDDQVRTPTYVGDLADGIVKIIERKARGVYHLAGKDVLTPYQMACIAGNYLQLDTMLIVKAVASDFSQPALRPARTGFIIDKAINDLGYNPISFDEGLKITFSNGAKTPGKKA